MLANERVRRTLSLSGDPRSVSSQGRRRNIQVLDSLPTVPGRRTTSGSTLPPPVYQPLRLRCALACTGLVLVLVPVSNRSCASTTVASYAPTASCSPASSSRHAPSAVHPFPRLKHLARCAFTDPPHLRSASSLPFACRAPTVAPSRPRRPNACLTGTRGLSIAPGTEQAPCPSSSARRTSSRRMPSHLPPATYPPPTASPPQRLRPSTEEEPETLTRVARAPNSRTRRLAEVSTTPSALCRIKEARRPPPSPRHCVTAQIQMARYVPCTEFGQRRD